MTRDFILPGLSDPLERERAVRTLSTRDIGRIAHMLVDWSDHPAPLAWARAEAMLDGFALGRVATATATAAEAQRRRAINTDFPCAVFDPSIEDSVSCRRCGATSEDVCGDPGAQKSP